MYIIIVIIDICESKGCKVFIYNIKKYKENQ